LTASVGWQETSAKISSGLESEVFFDLGLQARFGLLGDGEGSEAVEESF
jgi:hypothetical protein